MINAFMGNYRFLSNFFYAPVAYAGHSYRSAEHAFQAAKAACPEDEERVRNANSPTEAKRLGRTVRLRPDWAESRIRVMEEIVLAKFEQNPNLLVELLATGDEELVEGNWWRDTFWGVCRGEGENHLGKILMRVRSELRTKASVR